MSPNAWGWEGLHAGSPPMSTAVHMRPKINFGGLTPYLTYEEKVQNTVRLQQGVTSKNAQYSML
jgi:hypothetical protein